MSLRNNIIINGVTETYAERTTAAADDNDPFDQPPLPQEDTIETACAIFRDFNLVGHRICILTSKDQTYRSKTTTCSLQLLRP